MLKLIYDDGIDTALKIRHFPAGELSCEAPGGNPVAVEWHYESDEEIFQLYCLKRHYPSLRSLFVPYLPHARMDRVKKDSDIFTLKYLKNVDYEFSNLDFIRDTKDSSLENILIDVKTNLDRLNLKKDKFNNFNFRFNLISRKFNAIQKLIGHR